MAAHPVVVFFDVVEKGVGGFRSCGVAAAFFGEGHTFAFVGGVEAFHRRVVVGVGSAAHARFQAGGTEQGAILITCVLHAAITVVEQSWARMAVSQCHL